MTGQRNHTIASSISTYNNTANLSEDQTIMQKVRKIVAKGNNVEIKRAKDGSLTIMEVEKHKI